jgi:Subunit 11 of the general transcription factor TFIIH
MAASVPESDGFLCEALPSPISTTSTTPRTNLPQPRFHPLRAGSTKEETARRYVEGRLLRVSRRYTKKFQPAEPGDEVTGYISIRDTCRDLSEIVDVLWLSGTRESFGILYSYPLEQG